LSAGVSLILKVEGYLRENREVPQRARPELQGGFRGILPCKNTFCHLSSFTQFTTKSLIVLFNNLFILLWWQIRKIARGGKCLKFIVFGLKVVLIYSKLHSNSCDYLY